MIPILASNFSNLYAFLTGGPALVLGILFGTSGFVFRARSLRVIGAVLCIGGGVWILASLKLALESDRALTIWCGGGGILAGIVSLAARLTPRQPKQPAKGSESIPDK